MSYTQVLGRFSKVNGVPVKQRFPRNMGTTSWDHGHPVGILFHYTAGCQSDLSSIWSARGLGAQFSVDRAGVIYQYKSANSATWHAFSASHFYIGIEHTRASGACEFTDVQLEASAKLAAALVEYAKKKWGVDIPTAHMSGPALVPGFKDHADGTTDTWNTDGHVDRLLRWTWDKYLGAVKAALKPPVKRHWLVTVPGQEQRVYNATEAKAFIDRATANYAENPPQVPVDIVFRYDAEGVVRA